jgi:hypothetical protein
MQRLFASMLTALVMSLIGIGWPTTVPQAWAGTTVPVSAAVRMPGNDAVVKRCPGPRHPQVTAGSPDLRRPRPEIRRPRPEIRRPRPAVRRPVRI